MNILRLVAAEKEKKQQSPNPNFRKLEEEAACKEKGECTAKYQTEDLKKRLSTVQYHVTQQKGTERYIYIFVCMYVCNNSRKF